MENNTSEHQRLREKHSGPVAPWRKWGPYVSERSWGSVREDYSADGCAWEFLTHDMARSKAYRWGEDGIAGICDRYQLLVFALALWNGRDPILKERMFGLTGNEGNHGEDAKEYWFYLDNTPTHSYMKMLYKYPQGEFPYQKLMEENRRRWGQAGAPEYELLDTGIFDEDRYFDVFIEYAKAGPEDICVRIEAINRGPEAAELHLMPHLWFRNTWAWTDPPGAEPSIRLKKPETTCAGGRRIRTPPACTICNFPTRSGPIIFTPRRAGKRCSRTTRTTRSASMAAPTIANPTSKTRFTATSFIMKTA